MVSSLVSSGVEALGNSSVKLEGVMPTGIGGTFLPEFSTFASRNPGLFRAIMLVSGGLSGGISSSIAGGKFIDGLKQGLITSGLNHMAHLATSEFFTRRKAELLIWKKAVSGKDVGHTAIRIDKTVYGYYPTDMDGDGAYGINDLENSRGVMHIDSEADFAKKYAGDTIDVYSLKMSDRQISILENNLLKVANNPGYYKLWGNTCTSIAINALINSGVSIYNTNVSRFGVSVFKENTGVLYSPNHLRNVLNLPPNQAMFYNHQVLKIPNP